MKILHVYKSYYPETCGGVEKVIATLAQQTTPFGFQHQLLTTTTQTKHYRDVQSTLTIDYFPQTINIASCPMSLELFKKSRALFAAADLLHYHFPWPFADLLSLLQSRDTPSVITYHSDIVKQKMLKLTKQQIQVKFFRFFLKILFICLF